MVVTRRAKTASSGMSFISVLFLIFLVLKLTGNIDWSWWWVTAPMWGSVLLAVICGVLLCYLDKE